MRQFYTAILLALLIAFSSSCKKDPDLLQRECMLQNGELFRPKIVKTESSFKISSNIPKEQYGLYIYNSEGLLSEVQSYDKSDSSLYKTSHFVYSNGKLLEYYTVHTKHTQPPKSNFMYYEDDYLYKIKTPTQTLTFHRDYCNYISHEHTSENNNYVEQYRYEINDGNIISERIYITNTETGDVDSSSWNNYSYYDKPNQVTEEKIPNGPMLYNRNLLRSEEMCVRWPDGHTACTGADFEYDFDEQGRITKFSHRERASGSVTYEVRYYYE